MAVRRREPVSADRTAVRMPAWVETDDEAVFVTEYEKLKTRLNAGNGSPSDHAVHRVALRRRVRMMIRDRESK